jgi:hypothetical protein
MMKQRIIGALVLVCMFAMAKVAGATESFEVARDDIGGIYSFVKNTCAVQSDGADTVVSCTESMQVDASQPVLSKVATTGQACARGFGNVYTIGHGGKITFIDDSAKPFNAGRTLGEFTTLCAILKAAQ